MSTVDCIGLFLQYSVKKTSLILSESKPTCKHSLVSYHAIIVKIKHVVHQQYYYVTNFQTVLTC